ncbi:MAG: glycosyltransferase family 4 protein [Conexivisphaerales archaeon]
MAEIRLMATFFHDYQYGKVLGGVERRFVELSNEFKKRKIKAFAVEYEPSLSKAMKVGYISITVKRKSGRNILELVQIFRLGLLTALACRKSKCNVIYSTSSVYTNLITAYFASKICRIPFVVVFHSFPYQNSSSILKDSIRVVRGMLGGSEAFTQAIINLLRNRAFASTKACLTVSKATKDRLVCSFRPRLVLTTGNGISGEWFMDIKTEKIYDGCYVGRISPRKRIDFLLRIWKSVVEEKRDAKLVIVGGAESQRYFNHCLDIVKQLGLQDNVTFTGFVEDSVLRDILASSKTFITTSEREGFGLAILEAMALKVPCILPSLPALKENFKNCALFVGSDEPSEWSKAVLSLLYDRAKSQSISERAYLNALKYSWDSVADKELLVLKQVVNSIQS